MKKLIEIKRRGSDESGFTLLEYCAGAAIICGVVWAALEVLGTNLSQFIGGLSTWTSARTSSIGGGTSGTGGASE